MDKMKQTLSKTLASISSSTFQGLSIRIGPIWLFLVVVLCLFQNTSAFRVKQKPDSIEKYDPFPPYMKAVKRTQTALRTCYHQCQTCRTIQGYNNYDYQRCVRSCDSRGGNIRDPRCTAFRTEDKRTNDERASIDRCKNRCGRFANRNRCSSLEKQMGELLCKDLCRRMELVVADALTCAIIRAADRDVFQVTD